MPLILACRLRATDRFLAATSWWCNTCTAALGPAKLHTLDVMKIRRPWGSWQTASELEVLCPWHLVGYLQSLGEAES